MITEERMSLRKDRVTVILKFNVATQVKHIESWNPQIEIWVFFGQLRWGDATKLTIVCFEINE